MGTFMKEYGMMAVYIVAAASLFILVSIYFNHDSGFRDYACKIIALITGVSSEDQEAANEFMETYAGCSIEDALSLN